MPVVSATPDLAALTLTLVSEFPHPPERVWQVWEDPRRLERWWGPPTWPATVTAHDLRPGGRTDYVMTGPDGETAGGLWQVLAVDAPRSLSIEDSFADAEGAPDTSMPTTRMDVTLAQVGAVAPASAASSGVASSGTAESSGAAGTRMTVVTTFTTAEQMEQVMAMGVVEGMTEAAGQIDAVLAG